MRRRSAFSLVELAVVAGLMAVLLTVLYESSYVGTQASTKGIARLDAVMKANRFCEQLKHVLRTAKVVRASYPRPFETVWVIDYVDEVDEHTLAHHDVRAVVGAKPLIVNGQTGVELSFQRGSERPITYPFLEAQVRIYGARRLLAAQVTLEASDRHAFAVGSPYFEAALSNLEPPEAAVVDLLTPPPGLLVGGRIKAGRGAAPPPVARGPVASGPVASGPVAPGLPPITRGTTPLVAAPAPVAAVAAVAPVAPVAPAPGAAPPAPASVAPAVAANSVEAVAPASSLADNFPPAGFGPSRPPVTALPVPPEDPLAWNGASAIDPGAAGDAATATAVTTGAAPRMAGRLAPVARQLPGLAKTAAPAARPRPPLSDPSAAAALPKPEVRLKALAKSKGLKGAEQELPARAATNSPFDN